MFVCRMGEGKVMGVEGYEKVRNRKEIGKLKERRKERK